jgi:hypothetical protein
VTRTRKTLAEQIAERDRQARSKKPMARKRAAPSANGQPQPSGDAHASVPVEQRGDVWHEEEWHREGAADPNSAVTRETKDAADEAESLPVIDAGNEDLAAVGGLAWEALQQANEPPVLFRHGAMPSRIEADDEGAPTVKALNIDRTRHRLARVARWEKTVVRKVGKKTETVVVVTKPPLDVVRDVLATPDPPLPVLTRIVEAPIFAPDGTLQTAPGYSPASRTFYAPAPGFTVPPIAPHPTTAEVQQGRTLLCDELLSDFPFAGDAERAHALACLLLPFCRDMIDGPTPLYLFEAPSPGTGKTLLVDLLTFPALGRPVSCMTEGKDEDEWRKRVFAKLRSGPSILVIDNLKRRLESGAVSSAITAWPLWEDRVLGVSETARVPVRCAWLATGNNPALSQEITRRAVRCRLDAKLDRPWLREGFRHPDIRQWTRDNRGALVGAALTLIRAWLREGRPAGGKTLGMFESWAKTLGGILDVAGVPGFLGNLEDLYERADTDTAAWGAFVTAWWDAKKTAEVKAGDLWGMATEAGIDLGEKSDASQKTRLGRMLREMRDRVFAIGDRRLRLESAGDAQRAKLWKLSETDI